MQPAQLSIFYEEFLLFFNSYSIQNSLQLKLCVYDWSFSLILAINLHPRRFTDIMNDGSVMVRKTSSVVRKPRDTLLSFTLHFGLKAIGSSLPRCLLFYIAMCHI